MQILKTLAAVLTLATGVASASPIVMDFNSSPAAYGFGTIVEDGYQVTGSGSYHLSLGGARYCGPACPDNGSNNLLMQSGSFTVSAVGGAAFSLLSFDAGESHMGLTDYWARQVRVTGQTVAGGTVAANFALDFVNDGPGAAVDFQTFVLGQGFGELRSAVFTGIGGPLKQFTLDNITLDKAVAPAAASNAVPEPGSLLLAALALAGLGATRRRQTLG